MIKKRIAILFLSSLIALLLLEISLHLLYKNPYVLPDENAYLHYPNLHLKFSNLDTLYKEAPDIVSFNTSDLGYI